MCWAINQIPILGNTAVSMIDKMSLMARFRQTALTNARPKMLAAIQQASGLANVANPIQIASR